MQKALYKVVRSPAFLLVSWILLGLYFSWLRSIWADEFTASAQIQNGLVMGIREIFAVGNPYAPGELILLWSSKQIFSNWLPMETWMRLAPLAWSAGTLAVAISLARKRNLRFLPLLAYFSVTLMWYGGDVRPYAALLFGGAWALKLLVDPSPLKPKDYAITLIALGLGHIYGLCFVTMACLFRRQWITSIIGLAFIVFCMKMSGGAAGRLAFVYDRTILPPPIDLAKQTFAALGNPKKVAVFFVPLATLGLFALWRQRRSDVLKLIPLFAASVAAPMAATIMSKFVFWPRQVVGGSLPFLFVAAYGLEFLYQRTKGMSRHAVTGLAVLISFGPWITTIALEIPPFPNVSMFNFREVAETLVVNEKKNILNLDPGEHSAMAIYLANRLGVERVKSVDGVIAGIPIVKYCWPAKQVCLYSVSPNDLGITSEADYLPGGRVFPILATNEIAFDAVIYHHTKLPPQPEPYRERMALRSW